ncbi:MAG: hypothetical protein U1E95_07875 [Rubrivivax sp.]
MQQFEDSTLWRLSAYERMRLERSSTAFAQRGEHGAADDAGVRPAPARLARESHDVLEVLAACLRHRQSAPLCLRYEDLVWPLTVFPLEGLYSSPRALAREAAVAGAAPGAAVLRFPGPRPPGHWMHERITTEHYHELKPLLWNLALIGPRTTLLREIGGPAAYRCCCPRITGRTRLARWVPPPSGCAANSASLREIARWPGMTAERAARLLNALYMIGGLW